jgi:Xaa-Pro aminopeptidase
MNLPVEKLILLRTVLKARNIQACIIPSADPHLNEYLPDHWKIISWLTGFTGSAATVVITDSFAGLWTDSRYYLQSENQLSGSGFSLVKTQVFQKSDFTDWLAENLVPGGVVVFDGRLISKTLARKIEQRLIGKGIEIMKDQDLISELWIDRPPLSENSAFDFPVKYCGKERNRKISEVRDGMREKGVRCHLLSAPEDIMWLLNIRGSDVRYTPLFLSFAIITEDRIFLFADSSRIPGELRQRFLELDIEIFPYGDTGKGLAELTGEMSILVNPVNTSVSLYNSIPADVRIVEDISIPARLKSVKNKTEIENIGRAVVRDGVALTRFFFWMDKNFRSIRLTERLLAEKLHELRSQQENFMGPSFPPIVAFNEHGALPHYSETSDSDTIVRPDGILLVDSGGQYYEGTTDITRTIATGRPSSQQAKDFTLVLKGMIGLSTVKFPLGTTGCHLDTLARQALWDNGLNYGHGTGHGVGFCLNVHEGPVNISPALPADNKNFISAGMLFSNEPAIYREGEYGIRTENMMICYEDEETEYGQFLRFDTVSLCYIDKTLIDTTLLSENEISWINSYHQEVFEKLHPFLNSEESLWLKEKTAGIAF